MGTGSIFNIGVSGLNAAQAGLAVTSHNIANASTDGFHRQYAMQGTETPQETGAGFFGHGVDRRNGAARLQPVSGQRACCRRKTQGSYLDTYNARSPRSTTCWPIPRRACRRRCSRSSRRAGRRVQSDLRAVAPAADQPGRGAGGALPGASTRGSPRCATVSTSSSPTR